MPRLLRARRPRASEPCPSRGLPLPPRAPRTRSRARGGGGARQCGSRWPAVSLCRPRYRHPHFSALQGGLSSLCREGTGPERLRNLPEVAQPGPWERWDGPDSPSLPTAALNTELRSPVSWGSVTAAGRGARPHRPLSASVAATRRGVRGSEEPGPLHRRVCPAAGTSSPSPPASDLCGRPPGGLSPGRPQVDT